MAVIFSQPTTIPSGTSSFGPVTLASGVSRVTATFNRWNGNRTLRLAVQFSFGGSPFREFYAVGPVAPAQLVDVHGNQVDFDLVVPAWMRCGICGEPFDPTVDNTQKLVHSDHAGWTSAQIAALPDLSSIVFHTPTDDGSVRQAQMGTAASGTISTLLTIDAS